MQVRFPLKKYKLVKNYYKDYTKNLERVLNQIDFQQLEKVSSVLEKKILNNKNIFVCGNGGSAAISNHYVCDYIKLLRSKTNLKPRVTSLSTNLEVITAISNDISYDKIFSEQLSYLANKNDILIIISSSGNSKNIINAIKYCKKNKIQTIGFSGFNGGYLFKNCDFNLYFPANNYGLSEDSHHILMHVIMQFLRQKFTRKNISKIIF